MGYCDKCQSAGSVNRFGYCEICGTDHDSGGSMHLEAETVEVAKTRSSYDFSPAN